MLSLCAGGIILKLVLNIVYTRLMRASDNMGTSNNELTLKMKKKFEACYKLKIGVNNVDIFVDKYVYRHRFCGILLSTWENIGGQVLMLCLLLGSISAVLGLIYECGKQAILSTFSVGILTSGLLIFLEGMMNLTGKKELIRLNMKDYLENFFKVRLEQELFHPELMEQYKKDYLVQEGGEIIINKPTLVAVKAKEDYKKSSAKAEKRVAKKQQIEADREYKKNLKADAKAAKEREKEEKRLTIEKKKEDDERKRLELIETNERMKKEAKLALEQRREAERIELEQRAALAKAEEEQKREEKRRQEEIQKALLLEKKVMKEEKQNQSSEHKTIAQERKESLKREAQERRSKELPEGEKVLATQSLEQDKGAETIMEVKASTEKISESPKAQIKSIYSKKVKQSDPSEEKLIEDILKEFLA
jgi:hypothetical protein